MELFSPMRYFLRVDDKFYPDFVDLDAELRQGPSFLYVQLFRRCRDRERCVVPQTELAKICKCSTRSIQNALRSLIRLEYIRVEPQEEGPNAYALLLSPRVKRFLKQAGVEAIAPRRGTPLSSSSGVNLSSPAPAQNLRGGDEKFAYSLRDLRDQDPPLPPRTPLPPSQPVGSSSAPGRGGGGSPARVNSAQTHPGFESLWAAWPNAQNKTGALRMFKALARTGEMPPVDRLLGTVKMNLEQDERWKRGYAPHLVNWLRDRRWEDAPFRQAATPDQLQEGKQEPAGAAELRAKVRAVHERYGSGLFKNEESDVSAPNLLASAAARHPIQDVNCSVSAMAAAAFQPDSDLHSPKFESSFSALAALWPDSQRQPALHYLRYLSASGLRPDPERLADSARRYLGGTRKPVALVNWLREQFGVRHAQTARICPC